MHRSRTGSITAAAADPTTDVYNVIGIKPFEYELPFGVTSVSVPGTVKTIQGEAFQNSDSLCRVELNEGLETIGYEAFEGCPNLWEINIPSAQL